MSIVGRALAIGGVVLLGWAVAYLSLADIRRPTDSPPAPCVEAERCADSLPLSGGGVLTYYRSVPLTPNPAIRRAVLVVHGNRRDADRYFERLVRAARAEQRLGDVALFAPAFRTIDDDPTAREHYWSSGGWKVGNRSRDRHRASSFAVLDELLGAICRPGDRAFPDLDAVVLIGHSAGGQFVNRYAAGGRGCTDPAVEVRYVVMNPSSYLYLDGRRPARGGTTFTLPVTHCRKYDEYKYGLQDMNAYMKAIGPEGIRRNLFTRKTYYLAGDADTKQGGSLDESCEGRLQGPNRLARFEAYQAYRSLFEGWTGAHFETVDGIGHSGSKMLLSDAARRIAFR